MRRVILMLAVAAVVLAGQSPRSFGLPGSAWRIEPFVSSKQEARIALGTYEGTLGVFDSKMGRLVWERPLDGFPFAIAAAPGSVQQPSLLAATGAGTLFAFDEQGRLLWRHRDSLPLYGAAFLVRAGKPAFVATGGIGRKVMVLSLKGEKLAEYGVQYLVHRLMAADLDADGASEILVLDSRNDLEALRFDGKSLFRLWRKPLNVPEQFRNWENPGAKFFAVSIDAGDIDGDGRPEIAVGDAFWNKHPVMLLDAKGEPRWISPRLPQANSPSLVYSADRRYEFYSSAFVRIAGAEVVVVTGGNLRFFSSKGELQLSAESSLGFADLAIQGGRLYLGSTPNGDRTLYELPLDANLKANFEGLRRAGLAAEIATNLQQLSKQVKELPAPPSSGSPILVRWTSTGGGPERLERARRELEWFHKQFPYPRLQPYITMRLMEKSPPLDASGEPWNPARWKTDALNGTMTVEEIVETARQIERLGIPTLFNIGHSCMPFITLETAEKVLQAAPRYLAGFETAEDEDFRRVPEYMRDYLGPLSDLCRRYGGKIVSTKNKNVWWMSMPAQEEVFSSLFAGDRRGSITAVTEDSNSRTPEINLMARFGLRQAGLIQGFAATVIQDLFTSSRFHQWEYPRSGHPFLRLLVAQTSLGANHVELRIPHTFTNDGVTEWTTLGHESSETFLHLLGKGLLGPPAPGQVANLCSVGIAVHAPPRKWLVDGHNGHQPWIWEQDPEMESAVLPHNGNLWGNTPTPPHALTRILFSKQRQFGYHVPPTPFGAVAMVPALADLRKVEGVSEWWHTDGMALWREGGARLTGSEAAKALRSSLEAARSKLRFLAEGDEVFVQAIRLSESRYRVILIDPGWLDPQARRVNLHVQLSGRWTASDALSGKALQGKDNIFGLTVPAGSLRILEFRPRQAKQPRMLE